MALTICHECKAEVSTEAKACPKCGAQPKKPMSIVKIIFLGLLALMVYRCAESTADRNAQQAQERQKEAAKIAAMTPEARKAMEEAKAREAADKAKEEAKFQKAVLIAQAIKKSLKNPDSFTISNALLMDDGTLCIEYRGTNSFNAIVPEMKAIGPDLKEKTWNKACAGKTGRDITYIKSAM